LRALRSSFKKTELQKWDYQQQMILGLFERHLKLQRLTIIVGNGSQKAVNLQDFIIV
jgi:hypothetical protein